MAGAIEPAVQRPFQHRADQGRGDEGERQSKQEGHAPAVHRRDGDIAADHGEGTMGQIDEIHQAQGDRQSDADQEEQAPIRKSVEQNPQEWGKHVINPPAYLPKPPSPTLSTFPPLAQRLVNCRNAPLMAMDVSLVALRFTSLCFVRPRRAVIC